MRGTLYPVPGRINTVCFGTRTTKELLQGVSNLCVINDGEASGRQYESKVQLTCVRKCCSRRLQRLEFEGYNVPAAVKCEMLGWGRIYLLSMLQQILKLPFMGTNASFSTTSQWGSDAFERPNCGTNLVRCILYALPKLLCGINNVGVSRMFHGTPQVKVYRIEIWWPWWPRHRSLGTTRPIQCPG
jgi:hypothetical protein